MRQIDQILIRRRPALIVTLILVNPKKNANDKTNDCF